MHSLNILELELLWYLEIMVLTFQELAYRHLKLGKSELKSPQLKHCLPWRGREGGQCLSGYFHFISPLSSHTLCD